MKKFILIPHEKYVRLFSPSEERSEPSERLERSEPANAKKENKLSDQDILSLLPEKLGDRGKQFLHFLKTEPSIDWDEKGRVIIDGNILNFSHITDFLKDTLQPGKPIEPVEHLESWYAKLSNSVPLSLVHAQRRPYVIKGRDLEKKGFGNRAEINSRDHPSQEPLEEPLEEPLREPLREPLVKALVEPLVKPLREPLDEPPVKALVEPVQASREENLSPIIIPPGIPDKSPKKVYLKRKWQTLSI